MTKALLLLIVALALSGCQVARQIRCAKANGDAEACRAMSDECVTSGGPRCGGASCAGTYCRPDAASKTCALMPDWRSHCPRDARIFREGAVGDLEKYEWARKRMSPAVAKLSGKRLTREDFALLTDEDRRQLCQAYPKESCSLTWNEAQGLAVCELGPDPCSGCQYGLDAVKCAAKNLCSGVICL